MMKNSNKMSSKDWYDGKNMAKSVVGEKRKISEMDVVMQICCCCSSLVPPLAAYFFIQNRPQRLFSPVDRSRAVKQPPHCLWILLFHVFFFSLSFHFIRLSFVCQNYKKKMAYFRNSTLYYITQPHKSMPSKVIAYFTLSNRLNKVMREELFGFW